MKHNHKIYTDNCILCNDIWNFITSSADMGNQYCDSLISEYIDLKEKKNENENEMIKAWSEIESFYYKFIDFEGGENS